MSSSVLQRRRVNAAASGSDADGEDVSANSNGHAHPSSTPPATITHAGSAFQGGSKIAFDPRDLEQEDEDSRAGGKPPRLTLMEEVLLLGLKDQQGYLSFWNDNISYALRGCILIELALRRRIVVHKDPNRRRLPVSERLVEVIDSRHTGETILDESLKMMKAQDTDRMTINNWIDLLSGETWNVLKIGYQLKQVRERLAKGLVDKGVLRTEKRNFLLFDMATHPVADVRAKDAIVQRVVSLLTATTSTIPSGALHPEGTQMRALRGACLVCSAYAASVLDNAFYRLGYEEREAAFARCDDILSEFSAWPFGSTPAGSSNRKHKGSRIGMGSSNDGREAILGLVQEVRKEMSDGDEDGGCELIAGVLEVMSKLDSLL